MFCTPCYYYSDVFDEELCRPQVLRTNAVTYYVILSQLTVFSGAASMRGSSNRESPKKGAEEEADVTRGVGGDSGTKRGTSVGQNLRKRRGRHVTRSFVLLPSWMGLKNLRSASISPTRYSQFKFQRNFDGEPRGPTAISPLQVDPPTAPHLRSEALLP